VNGKAGISAAMAIRLAASFPQTDAQFWVNLQSNYELSCALKEKP
jgi:plasmid maintenance system antidote protein VapI